MDETDLPDMSNFSYLRSLLRGEALAAISGLALSGTSYQAACDILKKRFGRLEKPIFLHIEALLNVKQHDLQHLQDELCDPGVSTFENDCGCPTYICWQGRCHEVLTRVDGLRCVKPAYPQILISPRISVTLF